jgi:hypothetical protein
MFAVPTLRLKEAKTNFCLQPGFSMEMYNPDCYLYNVISGGINCILEIELPNVGMENGMIFKYHLC